MPVSFFMPQIVKSVMLSFVKTLEKPEG
ncbi:hypothetical protein ENC_22100 [Enterobacter hormaechei]|nr:hypothetical protein ENC_22100 [Enterobacter hormaechei]